MFVSEFLHYSNQGNGLNKKITVSKKIVKWENCLNQE